LFTFITYQTTNNKMTKTMFKVGDSVDIVTAHPGGFKAGYIALVVEVSPRGGTLLLCVDDTILPHPARKVKISYISNSHIRKLVTQLKDKYTKKAA